jgi:hypothetical protein
MDGARHAAHIAALRDRYVQAQLHGDRGAALAVVQEALAAAVTVPEVHLEILQAAQYEIGRLWERNAISIATEHQATAISQLALAVLYDRLPRGPHNGKRVILACVEGELHDMGVRVAADFLEMGGFEVRLLGASVPPRSLCGPRRRAASPSWSAGAPSPGRRSPPPASTCKASGPTRRSSSPRPGGSPSRRRHDMALADDLEALTPALSRRCTDAMYADPFWHARFGQRGRHHADEDSAYHVRYLCSALRAEDPEIFRRYAAWLRGVLASRGMCSWHLAESFRQLAAAMREERVAAPEPAMELLKEGERALHYTQGDAGALQRAAAAVAGQVRAQVPSSYRLDELLSFVADAIDRRDTSSVPAHVTFLRTTLARDEAERAALRRTIEAIEVAVDGALGPAVGAGVRALFASSAGA